MTCGLNRKHFPPFEARAGSGSDRIFVNLSRSRSSFVFVSCVLCCDIFLIFKIRAADIGIVLENNERSRVAAAAAVAERTMGGRKRDIASKEEVRLLSYTNDIRMLGRQWVLETHRHGLITLRWTFAVLRCCEVGVINFWHDEAEV
jgi:hypothetical protein